MHINFSLQIKICGENSCTGRGYILTYSVFPRPYRSTNATHSSSCQYHGGQKDKQSKPEKLHKMWCLFGCSCSGCCSGSQNNNQTFTVTESLIEYTGQGKIAKNITLSFQFSSLD